MSDSKVCRLCLVEAEVACPIFGRQASQGQGSAGGVALPERIMSFAQIKIVEGDGLPASVCHQCLAQVDKSYHFKLQCERADATLRKNFEDKIVFLPLKKELELTNGSPPDDLVIRPSPMSSYKGGDSDTEERERPVSGDSESVDGWEVMKFTPEVIINEEDSRESMADAKPEFSNTFKNVNGTSVSAQPTVQPQVSLVEQQLYQLSQVEAILRNHGTEIKVQGQPVKERRESSSGATNAGPVNPLTSSAVIGIKNGGGNNSHAQITATPVSLTATATAVPAGNGTRENGAEDYFPLYGVEAILNSADAAGGSRSSRRSRDGEKLFKCRLCPKSYSFSSALSRHKAVHNTMLRPHVCPICKKGFAEPEKLERHSRTHLVDRTWRCNHCGRIFKALNTYERHISTMCSYRSRKENGIRQLPRVFQPETEPAALIFRNS